MRRPVAREQVWQRGERASRSRRFWPCTDRGPWLRAALLGVLVLVSPGVAQSPLPYPPDCRSTLVKYAVVDRADGFSRDLYASPDVLEALRRDARLTEFPVGARLAIDAHSARQVGREARTRSPIFEKDRQGRLVRSKDERTLHLMQKTRPGFGSQTWTFAGYDPLTTEPLKLQLPGDCLLCHQAALVSDMAFSLGLLRRFTATGEVQYAFCGHPGRQSCRF
jgi:hypothetical protein